MISCWTIIIAIILAKGFVYSEKSIVIKFKKKKGEIFIGVYAYQKVSEVPMKIDIESDFTYLIQELPGSITAKDNNRQPIAFRVTIDGAAHYCNLMRNDLYLEHIKENPRVKILFVGLNYCYFDKKENIQSNTLGLSYKQKNNLGSPVGLLRQFGYIQRKGFGFWNVTQDEGNFYFGDFSREEIQNKAQSSCQVNSNYSTWGCELQYVFFGRDVKKGYWVKEKYVVFSTKTTWIIAPMDFMSFLKKTVFADYFKKRDCFDVIESGYRKFSCKCAVVDDFPTMSFVIEEREYLISREDLFSKANKACVFSVLSYEGTKGWKIGSVFYRKFAPFFSYDNKTVGFFSDSRTDSVTLDKAWGYREEKSAVQAKRKIFLICSFILVFSLGSLVMEKATRFSKSNPS